MHVTYVHDSRRREICVVAIKAAVVDPLGLYANWSVSWSEGMAGNKCLRTTNLSVMRDRIGVTDMGRRWENSVGGVFLGTGVTSALSHVGGEYP